MQNEEMTISAVAWDGTTREMYHGPQTVERQAAIDAQLQEGRIASVDILGASGGVGSQYLPSYCQGGWPQCLDCTCRQHQGEGERDGWQHRV